jgi:hypothetical protein
MWSFLTLLVFLGGCSEEIADPQDSAPKFGERLEWSTDVDTEGGRYHLELTLEPLPAQLGLTTLDMAISINSDNPCFSGAALLNAQVSLTGRRPEEGGRLGASIAAEELGAGDYQATWTFAQAGYWELEVEVGAAEDTEIVVIGLVVEN